jgi:hypothetical protein
MSKEEADDNKSTPAPATQEAELTVGQLQKWFVENMERETAQMRKCGYKPEDIATVLIVYDKKRKEFFPKGTTKSAQEISSEIDTWMKTSAKDDFANALGKSSEEYVKYMEKLQKKLEKAQKGKNHNTLTDDTKSMAALAFIAAMTLGAGGLLIFGGAYACARWNHNREINRGAKADSIKEAMQTAQDNHQKAFTPAPLDNFTANKNTLTPSVIQK